MTRGSRLRQHDGAATVVQAALIMPLLAVALGGILHLGLYLLSRSVVIAAVQQGLTVATATDGTPTQGETVAGQLIDGHSAATIVDLAAATTPTTVTLTATVQTPGLVPGLTRIVTVEQTATRQRWITP